MFERRKLEKRIERLEAAVREAECRLNGIKEPTLSVPVVDENGEVVRHFARSHLGGLCSPRFKVKKRKDLSFTEVCKALQDMCGIEITYQEIPGKSSVVIYEKDD